MFKYPYGDSQQLNLDWILIKLKELADREGQQITEDLEVISNALISATFSSSNAYNRSDIVFHDGKLYRANVNIPAPGESWNPAHWDEIMLGDTVANVVRYISSLNNTQVFNSSNVPGTHTSDALNNLKADIDEVSGFHMLPFSTGGTVLEDFLNDELELITGSGLYFARRAYSSPNTQGYFGTHAVNMLFYSDPTKEYISGIAFSDSAKQFATFRKRETLFEEKHYEFTSDNISNESNVTGATVTNALNNLNSPLSVSMINPGGTGGSVGAAILVITQNGKWILMDTHVDGYGVYNGNPGPFTTILQNKSPTGQIHIDYLMISHYHMDHVGGLIDWIDNNYLTNGTVDISNATVFLPQELTAANIANIVGDDPATLIARQTKIVNALIAQNCTIIRPTEGQKFNIDGATLRFTNCNHTVYTSGTYASTNYNDWSLCAYVETKSQRFFYTADIGPIGQKYVATLANSLLKSDIITAPHHGWQSGQTETNGLNPNFIKRLYPNVVLSPNGDVHKPDSGQAPSMYNFEDVMQTWCEENSVPNYPTCLNGTIDLYMYNQSWEFDKSYIAYIRNDKNWFYNIEKSFTIVPSHLYLVRKAGFSYIWALGLSIANNVTYYTENNTPGITDKIAEFYKINNWGNNRSFNATGIAKQNNTGGLNGEVHAVMLSINYGNDPYIGVFAKNLQGNAVDTYINGLFFLE